MPKPTRWSAVPLVLVVLLLVASVLIPARESWRIMHLLRETTEVIEPARTLVDRLELGLTAESSALERFAVTGDSADRAHYFDAADDNRRLTAIEDLSGMLGGEAVSRTATIRARVTEWRRIAHTIVEDRVPAAQRANLVRSERVSYQAAVDGIGSLSSYLSAEGNAHRELIRQSERSGLVVNAALVFVALAAVFAVNGLRDRERRLTAIVERRAQQEAALREASEALGAAFTVEDVTQQIVQSALRATGARGAFVEQIVPAVGDNGATLVVRASAGADVSASDNALAYLGSCTQLALDMKEPMLFPDLAAASERCTATSVPGAGTPALVVPLGHGGAPIGALFVIGAKPGAFRPDDLAWARTFGHLAMLAYEKVRLLDEARAGRAQLERVIKSRSRLMRGFSHDVKNPLGAADGYAELLTAGIYGPLSAEQHESVTRIRRSLRSAIDLIEDLHEMARAETGNIQLSPKLVDLTDVVRESGDEYRAVAEASGLTLTVDVPGAPLIAMTDRVRVIQILSNLLSNAIKYTAHGSIELRIRADSNESETDRESWAAIEVRDTGRGVDPDKVDVIFEEFVRLGPSDKSGAGLGLAVSQRLAKALGGRITVESEVGRGSTFTLWLPLQNLDPPAGSAPTPAVSVQPVPAVGSLERADVNNGL